ncbi:hypothetical protein FGO68_gene10886 [Halteria grandinella]|uniref:Uncharacterized protein n=1 Tax=Halteria grandinella TaxID=5974 RepID=A0A8J8NGH9_HALGN|nr:hypothetical protein FGO68_gene10886 [Halteria grandinella]
MIHIAFDVIQRVKTNQGKCMRIGLSEIIKQLARQLAVWTVARKVYHQREKSTFIQIYLNQIISEFIQYQILKKIERQVRAFATSLQELQWTMVSFSWHHCQVCIRQQLRGPRSFRGKPCAGSWRGGRS